MRDVVDVEIRAPRETVAQLFSDPAQNVEWMDDVERYEPISGAQGFPGSTYRLVSKTGGRMDFLATVVARDLPDRMRLELDSPSVSVTVDTTFELSPSGATRLVSTEDFRFKTLLGKLRSVFVKPVIHAAHQKHMDAFKRFAEDARQ